MIQLRPLILRPRYTDGIEKEIQRFYDDLIFRPLFELARGKVLADMANSVSALCDAARRGSVWYEDGQFRGTYSAAITRELRSLGAKYNAPSQTWTFPQELIPPQLKFALTDADSRLGTLRRDMVRVLGDAEAGMAERQPAITREIQRSLDLMESDFMLSVSAVDAVKVVPEFTPAMRDMISSEWAQNLDLYIKGWAGETILKLRQEIEPHALAGYRAHNLMTVLQESYGTSKSKAKFLAHQETSILMSKFRQARYGAIGVDRYRWSTSHDSRVRHDHKELNGKVYRFDSPPVTNKKTGARNNPGEDFGCRCAAIGLL